MTGGRAINREGRRIRSVPCITGLSQLESVSFQYLGGFRACEWTGRSCLALLTGLRYLDMSACGLRAVPVAMLGLSSLQLLCLGSNKLVELPVGEYLQRLTTLMLPNNRFPNVPVEALAAATALRHLTMAGNPLVWTSAQAEAVKHLEKLE
jgi:Leucine-rich repeat (LRR) protein